VQQVGEEVRVYGN